MITIARGPSALRHTAPVPTAGPDGAQLHTAAGRSADPSGENAARRSVTTLVSVIGPVPEGTLPRDRAASVFPYPAGKEVAR